MTVKVNPFCTITEPFGRIRFTAAAAMKKRTALPALSICENDLSFLISYDYFFTFFQL